jgi:hypothetical protein
MGVGATVGPMSLLHFRIVLFVERFIQRVQNLRRQHQVELCFRGQTPGLAVE